MQKITLEQIKKEIRDMEKRLDKLELEIKELKSKIN